MPPSQESKKAPADRFEVAYHRVPGYHVIHADGAFGGLTPQGNLAVNFFVEYREEPESIHYEVVAGRTLQEVRRAGRELLRRDLQVGVMMTPTGARSLVTWLTEKLADLDKAMSEAAQAHAISAPDASRQQ